MEYDTIVVPNCETLRSTTLERLEKFKEAGGRIIFMGSAPTLCDAIPSNRSELLAEKCERIDFTRASILTALESDRTLTIRYADGDLCDDLIYQLRKDENCSWLFVCCDKEPYNKDLCHNDDIRITIPGEHTVTLYDTQNGDIYPANVTYVNGNTVINEVFYGYDSKLNK